MQLQGFPAGWCTADIDIVNSDASSVGPLSMIRAQIREKQDEGSTLETLDFTISIGSTPTFLYFDLHLYTAYAAHYVYFN